MTSDLSLPDLPQGLDDPELYRWLESAQLFMEAIESGSGGSGSGDGDTIVIGGGLGTIEGDRAPIDFTKPPNVENFTLFTGNTFIGLTWDIPPVGAKVSYTEIARGVNDILAQAELGRISVGGFWYDNLGRGSVEYFYWARHVRDTGGVKVTGDWVLTPLSGQTLPELDEIVALIEGQLNELALTQALRERINLIDAVGTGVVDRINAEVTTRISEISRIETQSQADDDAIAAQIDSLILASGGRVIRDTNPPNPNTDVNAPFSGSDRWLDQDDGNHPYVWDADVGNTVTPPFNWVSVRDQEIQRNTALIATATAAIVDLEQNKAEASVVQTISTTVGQHTSSIQSQAQSLNGVLAEVFVRLDVDGRISGYGISGSPTSTTFLVNADTFVVSAPGQPAKPLFFVGQVNGAPTIVLDATAFIADASIGNAAIDSIAADKLFALTGTIADAIIGSGHIQNAMIGNVIQSDSWNPVTKAGWRLLKNGLFEGRGITIYDNDGAPVFGAGSGFALNFAQVSGATRPADNATRGAVWGEDLNGIPYLQESFEATQKWVQFSGDGNFVYTSSPSAQFGGRVLRANGNVHIDYTELIPFDENATYRLQIRVQSFGAIAPLFAGVQGFTANRQIINRVGQSSVLDQFYVLSNGTNVGRGGWTDIEGFIEGYAVGDGDLGDGTLENPARLHRAVRYIRPVMIFGVSAPANYFAMADRFVIDKTQTQITDQNISTFIKNAAIDTLYLAGSAVTVVAVAQGGGQQGSGNFSPIATVAISVNVPAPVLINWSLDLGFPVGQRDWGIRVSNLTTGQVLKSRIVTAVNDFPSGQVDDFIDPGTYIYELAWFGENSGVSLGEGSINVTASKR